MNPNIQHSNAAYFLTGGAAAAYNAALPLLAANPGATNRCLASLLKRPKGSMGGPARAARATLSISDTRGAVHATIEDRNVYVAACKVLGVTPCEGNAFRKVHTNVVTPLVATPKAAPPADDPFADVRRLVRALREHMKVEGIESLTVTHGDVQMTRSVTMTSALQV